MSPITSQPGVRGAAGLLVRSTLLVAVAAVPVGAALMFSGPLAAVALYLGIVVMTTAVPTLPVPQRWIAALWTTVVAFTGTLIGPHLGSLITAVVLCCLVQARLMRLDARALIVSPAILIYFAYSVPASFAAPVALLTMIGAAYLVALAGLAKLPPSPNPIQWSPAITHALLLALGCTVLLVIGNAANVSHAHWSALALCLAFVPGSASAWVALRYAAATVLGALAAILISLPGETWLALTAIIAGALLIVASSLAERPLLSVAGIAATVVLLGSLTPDLAASTVGLERTLAALLAVALGLILFAASGPLERAISRALPRLSVPRSETNAKGTSSWTR